MDTTKSNVEQVTPPSARNDEELEFDFSDAQGEATSEKWNTVNKDRKYRAQQTTAREKTRQRLYNQDNNSSLFDPDDKYDEEEELGVRQQEDEIVIEAVEEEGEEILEDDAVLRLGVMEQELLQEQEDKTKSEVLGDSNIDKLMNDVVGEKPIGIFD